MNKSSPIFFTFKTFRNKMPAKDHSQKESEDLIYTPGQSASSIGTESDHSGTELSGSVTGESGGDSPEAGESKDERQIPEESKGSPSFSQADTLTVCKEGNDSSLSLEKSHLVGSTEPSPISSGYPESRHDSEYVSFDSYSLPDITPQTSRNDCDNCCFSCFSCLSRWFL